MPSHNPTTHPPTANMMERLSQHIYVMYQIFIYQSAKYLVNIHLGQSERRSYVIITNSGAYTPYVL